MRPLNLAKEELEKLYLGEQLSLSNTADILKCSSASIHAWLVRHDIPRRSKSEATRIAISHKPAIHRGFPYGNKYSKDRYELNIDLIKALYLDMRFGVPEIARILNLNKELIRHRLKRAGLVFRRRGEALRGRGRPDLIRRNHSCKFQQKVAEALQRKPNKPEKYLNDLLQKCFPNQWEYVGDGKVIIHGVSPDFINCNGQKAVIEVFGDYWHGSRENIPSHQTDYGRKAIFAKYGYKTLILWESELNQLPESEIVTRIKEFTQVVE